MEKIYTIPVNEAFDETGSCPFCRMRKKLEENEIELVLGASMMEPDFRIQTNEKGFCSRHFDQMYKAQKRLPLALILESHLDQIRKECKTPAFALSGKLVAVSKHTRTFSENCYVCDRVDHHWGKMFETACLLWEMDIEFRRKMEKQTYFCLPCYTKFLQTAKLYISKKKLGDFLEAAQKVEMKYLDELKADVSHFCRKFDYRYQNEPWGNARTAVERSIRFLSGEPDFDPSAERGEEE